MIRNSQDDVPWFIIGREENDSVFPSIPVKYQEKTDSKGLGPSLIFKIGYTALEIIRGVG